MKTALVFTRGDGVVYEVILIDGVNVTQLGFRVVQDGQAMMDALGEAADDHLMAERNVVPLIHHSRGGRQ